jgi:hypothetical protein
MLLLVHQSSNADLAAKLAKELVDVFHDATEVVLIGAESPSAVIRDPAWDDLLLVMFDGTIYPEKGRTFISEYLSRRPKGAAILPIATDSAHTRPPSEAESIKAFIFEQSGTNPSRLVNRIGAMLGLRWQGRDSNLFISYRAKDGKAIANQLYNHLLRLGHRPFLDDAREFDDLPHILPGSPVQKEIDNALDNASLVLLVDTPSAPDSIWIKHEVDTADAILLPILPLCFKEPHERRKGPRFRSLNSLMRWVDLPFDPNGTAAPLSEEQLETITAEAEQYYCEIFRRKCRVPQLVEKQFSEHGFVWKVLNSRLLMFGASKRRGVRMTTSVLTHCSIFDQIYNPALQRFLDFLAQTQPCNHSLFVYDGDLLSEPELAEIAKNYPDSTMIILHHQDLATLIQSEFTMLGASS